MPIAAETLAPRRRGRRPADADARRTAVEQAIAELESARVPFSMNDVAERAGISRATLYRDAALRALIGRRGDSPAARPVNDRDLQRLKAQLLETQRLRRQQTRTLKQLEERATIAEDRARDLQRRLDIALSDALNDRAVREAYTDGFAAGQKAGGGQSGRGVAANELFALAGKMPRESLLNARRTLARVLHPDLFANDPAASLIATEILKQLNAIVQLGNRQ